jgi:hypothetical protein
MELLAFFHPTDILSLCSALRLLVVMPYSGIDLPSFPPHLKLEMLNIEFGWGESALDRLRAAPRWRCVGRGPTVPINLFNHINHISPCSVKFQGDLYCLQQGSASLLNSTLKNGPFCMTSDAYSGLYINNTEFGPQLPLAMYNV